MNKFSCWIITTLVTSTVAYSTEVNDADEFNAAISAVFGEAPNYFDFEGSFNSESKTITLSRVTRNQVAYDSGAFPLVISGSNVVTDGEDITYYITLVNGGRYGGTADDHLFNFNSADYPVILKLDNITAPNCKPMFEYCYGLIEVDLSNFNAS